LVDKIASDEGLNEKFGNFGICNSILAIKKNLTGVLTHLALMDTFAFSDCASYLMA